VAVDIDVSAKLR